eukprot:4855139-Amphidinium_carterae.1
MRSVTSSASHPGKTKHTTKVIQKVDTNIFLSEVEGWQFVLQTLSGSSVLCECTCCKVCVCETTLALFNSTTTPWPTLAQAEKSEDWKRERLPALPETLEITTCGERNKSGYLHNAVRFSQFSAMRTKLGSFFVPFLGFVSNNWWEQVKTR